MTNANDVRSAHDLLDRLDSLTVLNKEQAKLLRSFLPELPRQKTLEELRREVYDVWVGTNGNEWPDDIHVELETWLSELHIQLQGLKNNAEPAHPEFLETEADYENAPEGTVVAVSGSKIPTVKDDGWPVHMAVMPRYVLRWGWGE